MLMTSEIVKTIINTLLTLSVGALFAYVIAIPKNAKKRQQNLADMVQNLANSINNLSLQVGKHEDEIKKSNEERKVMMRAFFDITEGFKKMNGNISPAAHAEFDKAKNKLKDHLNEKAHD